MCVAWLYLPVVSLFLFSMGNGDGISSLREEVIESPNDGRFAGCMEGRRLEIGAVELVAEVGRGGSLDFLRVSISSCCFSGLSAAAAVVIFTSSVCTAGLLSAELFKIFQEGRRFGLSM